VDIIRLFTEPGSFQTVGLFNTGDPGSAIAQLYFTDPDLRYDPGDREQQQEIVRARFADVGWEAPRVLEEMVAASEFYFDTASQVSLDHWASGRVALIGDAGYAAGPGANGTGNAIVAAYVLAGELAAAAGTDYAQAFDNYERLLRPYVAAGQKQAGGGQAFLAPTSRAQIRNRNRFFKLARWLPIGGLIARVATRTATRVDLPDYQFDEH
jgi:2-polyprenyl-6-methoxyphenol hydroxylase-like FAD-dependent oxidoreductase